MNTYNDKDFIMDFRNFVEMLNVKSVLEANAKSDELGNAISDIVQTLGVDNDIMNSKSRKKYDLVFSSGTLQHLKEDEAIETIRKMSVFSKQYILNYVPNGNCVAYINNKAKTDAEWKNERDFTEETFRDLHKRAGLEVVQSGTTALEWAKRFGNELSEGYLVYVLAKKVD